jgi:hypothetical protein
MLTNPFNIILKFFVVVWIDRVDEFFMLEKVYFGPSRVRAPAVSTFCHCCHYFHSIFFYYNLTELEYNLPEPDYNLPEPDYNLTEPDYNLPELVPLLKSQKGFCMGS